MEKTVFNYRYQINYDNPRMPGDILSLEESFKTLQDAENYWDHLSYKDKVSMKNAHIVKNVEFWNEDNFLDCSEDFVKYLYLSRMDEKLINQYRKVIDKVNYKGYSEDKYPKPSYVRDFIKNSDEYTADEYNGNDIIWFSDIWENKKPDVAYDIDDDRFLTEEEMKDLTRIYNN